MKKENLFDIIGEVDDQKVAMACSTTSVKKKSNRIRFKWSTLAACLCFLIVVGMVTSKQIFTPRNNPTQDTKHPVNEGNQFWDALNNEVPNTDQPSNPNSSTAVQISLANVYVNEYDTQIAGAPLYYAPTLYDRVEWTENEIFEYYGTGIVPSYIPEGLSEGAGQRIIVSKTGEICSDTVVLLYYHEFDETGSPVYTDAVPANHGFSITVSKLGLLNDCCYTLPDDEVKQTVIDGVKVTFGYRAMAYPSTTNAENAYYDIYVAEFEISEVAYQLISEQMSIEDVVKVVSSIIYGTDDIDIIDG